MRWLLALPRPVDLTKLPHLSLRYRAAGQVAPTTYAIWLGDRAAGTGGSSVIALHAGRLKADDRWHTITAKVKSAFVATHLAVGLDCAGREAMLVFDTIRFGSRPPRWTIAEMLPREALTQSWPAGKDGFVVERVSVAGGKPSPFLRQRLKLSGWFASRHIVAERVPFVVETDAAKIPQTSTGGFGALSVRLPAKAREVYLLTAAAAPPTEPWGIKWRAPRPVEMLDVPEKVFYEIRYDRGPADRVLPLDAATGQWGMKRGLRVNVVHPDASRRPTQLLLHDRMQTASFAIVGLTILKDTPRITEPDWDHLRLGPVSLHALAAAVSPPPVQPSEPIVNAGVLRVRFDTGRGLKWLQLEVSGLKDHLSCSPSPVFEVAVKGKTLPSEDWSVTNMEVAGRGRRFHLRNRNVGLAATVECVPGRGNDLLLRMTLTNQGKTPITATLHFPVLCGITLGRAADTCYLFGKRGGIIHHANVAFREPLGERHPLQMDGFFNPRTGLALACLTHDTIAQHHFINVAKNDRGGAWDPEYVLRDLACGESFTATEAALVLREGGWRAIFAAYTEWLATWFKPAAPRKPWFERDFACLACNVDYRHVPAPKRRGAIQPLIDTMMKHIGICDWVHLFGWGSSETYGDWGDYDHYDETVGGLEYFRDNIRRVQDAGIPVSLYLDGYLSSKEGKFAGAQAEEWAMKKTDGSPWYVPQYEAYNQCPYMAAWRDYLSQTYARVARDLRTKILYIDEYGATDGRWKCHAKDHGHNGYEIPYAGEVAMLKQIREAVGPDVALYAEYPPAEVSRQYIDGSITYQALWSADQEHLAPHFIDLPRFAFPDFKQFHIIHYARPYAGNWWLFKFPFFNGEVFRVGEPGLPHMDQPSLAFMRRALHVQCGHREAFSSHNVRPLVPTEVSGVFANLFAAGRENVWTLYNANGRSVHKPVLQVKHIGSATYEDAWNGKPLTPDLVDGLAHVSLDLGPKAVGCVVQRRANGAFPPTLTKEGI